MDIVINILITLLVLTGLIVAHEFGHYMVAKRCGIRVDEFAIGFGPKLIKWRRGETEFSIRPIFVGGFVKFPDDVEGEAKPGDFRSASVGKRILTLFAGPAMNVILAIILSTILLTAVGDVEPFVATIQPDSPAAQAGLQEGDVIKDLNGTRIDFYYDMQDATKAPKGESMPITVQRGEESLQLNIPYMETDGQKMIGITMGLQPKTFNFFEALALSFKWNYLVMREMLQTLGNLFFAGQGVENLSGIVGVVDVVGQAARAGWANVVNIMALLSINLAIINLLPIPALDGGKIVLYAVEGVRKKPAPLKLEMALNAIGFLIIIGLSLFLVVMDVSRLVT